MQALRIGAEQERAAAVDQRLKLRKGRPARLEDLATPLHDLMKLRHQQHGFRAGQPLHHTLGQGLVSQRAVAVVGSADVDQAGSPYAGTQVLVQVRLGAVLRNH